MGGIVVPKGAGVGRWNAHQVGRGGCHTSLTINKNNSSNVIVLRDMAREDSSSHKPNYIIRSVDHIPFILSKVNI